MFRKTNKKAFTIIELIVVIVALGILVLIGMPKVIGYVGKAQLARIQHDVKVMEAMMEDELVRNLNTNYKEFDDNGKDLGLLIEAERLFEKEGHAKELEYVPIPGEINGINKYSNKTKVNSKFALGGPNVSTLTEEETFKEIYERYKVIPEKYKKMAGIKLKGTFYANEGTKVYYEPNKPILVKAEINKLACSQVPQPDYEFEHELGKIVKYNGNAEHLIIPSHFFIEGKCWPVRILGKASFMRGGFKSIVLPGTIVKIEEDAFKDLMLQTVNVPGSTSTIQSGAFDGNYNVSYEGPLSSLNGGNGYNYNSINSNGGNNGGPGTPGNVSIGLSTPNANQAGVVFNPSSGIIVKGSSLNPEYIPPFIEVGNIKYPVKKVAKGAYQGLGLITVQLPNTLEVIDDYAFSGNQLSGITIPNSVNHIGQYAFAFNEQVKSEGVPGPDRIATIKTIIIKEEEQFNKLNKVGDIAENNIKVNLFISKNKDKGPNVKLLDHIWATSINNVIIDVEYGTVGSGNEKIPKGYSMAEIEDFKIIKNNSSPNTYSGIRGYYKYIGDKEYIVIPDLIDGNEIKDYYRMFEGSNVKGVASDNSKITDMSYMFLDSMSPELELKYLNTSNVTNMQEMFSKSKATALDLSNFNTSKVINMYQMFNFSQALTFNLSSFNTSNVTNMQQMFYFTKSPILDLSSFDITKANINNILGGTSSTTTGYAKNIENAGKLNSSSSGKPLTLTFVVK